MKPFHISFLSLYIVEPHVDVGPHFCILITAATRVCQYFCMTEKMENMEVNELLY